MRFKVNDIVLSAPGWSKGIFVITKLTPENPKNQYCGANILTGKSFRLNEESLAPKRIGVADVVEQNETQAAPIAAITDMLFLQGQARAKRETKPLFGKTDPRWEILATLKAGDALIIMRNGREETVIFKNVIPTGAKYVFAATNSNGTTYKYQLEAIKVNMPKRTEDEIMEDIRDVECQLSPEVLTCDGELPRSQVERRRVDLMRRRNILVTELGRKPTDAELFPELFIRKS